MPRRLLQAVGEAALSLLRAWRSSTLALAAIVSAVFVLGAFLIVSQAVEDAVARWSDAAELSVFVRDDVTEPQRAAVEATLQEHATVREVRYVSAADARQRFSASFPDLASLLAAAGDAPLPASLEARLHREADPAAVATLADRLRAMPGVADVRIDQELLRRLLDLARAGRLVGGALSLVLVLAAALSIASVVRLSYVARRDEVDVLYLLGAPVSAIRGPFIVEGALEAALGTGLALALLAAAHAAVGRTYAEVWGDQTLAFLPIWKSAALLLGSLLIGAWAGLAAVSGPREETG
jgi:cell division transport system permease protein